MQEFAETIPVGASPAQDVTTDLTQLQVRLGPLTPGVTGVLPSFASAFSRWPTQLNAPIAAQDLSVVRAGFDTMLAVRRGCFTLLLSQNSSNSPHISAKVVMPFSELPNAAMTESARYEFDSGNLTIGTTTVGRTHAYADVAVVLNDLWLLSRFHSTFGAQLLRQGFEIVSAGPGDKDASRDPPGIIKYARANLSGGRSVSEVNVDTGSTELIFKPIPLLPFSGAEIAAVQVRNTAGLSFDSIPLDYHSPKVASLLANQIDRATEAGVWTGVSNLLNLGQLGKRENGELEKRNEVPRYALPQGVIERLKESFPFQRVEGSFIENSDTSPAHIVVQFVLPKSEERGAAGFNFLAIYMRRGMGVDRKLFYMSEQSGRFEAIEQGQQDGPGQACALIFQDGLRRFESNNFVGKALHAIEQLRCIHPIDYSNHAALLDIRYRPRCQLQA